jgi:hypothetical protein
VIPFHFQAHVEETGVVVPAHIAGKAELLTFLSHALSLPGYFGHNWDALEECLGDLDRQKTILVHRDIPLASAPTEQRLYLQILASVARDSDRLQVVFPESFREQVERLLSQTK